MKSILGEAEYEANLYDWKKEGLEEGKAEGRVEGIAESKKETARKLLLAGVDVSVISQCTGLEVENVLELGR